MYLLALVLFLLGVVFCFLVKGLLSGNSAPVITLNIPEHQLTINLWKQHNKNKVSFKGCLGAWK